MHVSQRILSDVVIFSKYAKYNLVLKRRETWSEIVDRYQQMMIKKYPNLSEEIIQNLKQVREKKVLPSMRALQFAGIAVEKNNARIYNCAYLPINCYQAFAETMFLLLAGTGVGFSVQRHHIDQLPVINVPRKKRRFLVADNIEGWADAVRALMKSYLYGVSLPVFDFSDIRERGEPLSSGGKAPGPDPLRECLFQVQLILEKKQQGSRLTPLECHDILCHIADAVLAGGIRRAALISLFSIDDEEMLSCKFGDWWELNSQRGRANNSVVFERGKVNEEQFFEIWKKIEYSNSGEPGIFWTNDKEIGTNPCCEISLYPHQFCNLCEVNVSDIESQEDLNQRVQVGAFLGTLQAGFTNFHYLRDNWKEQTEEQALIGVGMTGIGSGKILDLDLQQAAKIVKEENERVAKLISINIAARCTTVKPSGTSSLVLGTSSGIHAWYAPYYIRRIQVLKNEPLYTYLIKNHPQLVEDDIFKPHLQALVSIPQKAPEGAIMRNESALHFLKRIKQFNLDWVKVGHNYGINTHNVSATVYVKSHEWEKVGGWMWENQETFNGLSVLPYDSGSYKQAPFEEIDEQTYNSMNSSLVDIDLTQVIEHQDLTQQIDQLACSGDNCEVVSIK